MTEPRPDRKNTVDNWTPLEQHFLRELEPRAAAIVQAYFTADGKVDVKRAAEVYIEKTVAGIELIARAQGKVCEQPRRTEDWVQLDDDLPLYVVADGVSGRGRNVSALMAEMAALVATEQVRKLQQHQANATAIEQALRRLPDLSRQTLQTALRTTTVESEALQRSQPRDFATTLDVVYVATHLNTVFGLHIGNGRTFMLRPQDNADPIVQALTTAHDDGNGLASCVALDAGSATIIDLFHQPIEPGMMILTVTDGVYQPYEAAARLGPFQFYLSALDLPSAKPKSLTDSLGSIMAATSWQTDATRDDAAAALLRLPK